LRGGFYIDYTCHFYGLALLFINILGVRF